MAEADRLVAYTADEAPPAAQPATAPGRPGRHVVPPGVDLDLFRRWPTRRRARTRLGLPPDAVLLLFVGRIQPLKAPDVLLRAAAAARADAGAPAPAAGGDRRRPERDRARPSRVAARAGRRARHRRRRAVPAAGSRRPAGRLVPGRRPRRRCPATTSRSGWSRWRRRRAARRSSRPRWAGCRPRSGTGCPGCWSTAHRPEDWAAAIDRLIAAPGLRTRMAGAARRHAERFSWERTAEGLLVVYRGALADRGSARLAAAVGGP